MISRTFLALPVAIALVACSPLVAADKDNKKTASAGPRETVARHMTDKEKRKKDKERQHGGEPG